MKNKLFDTTEKIENAVSNFKNLLDHAGWQLFVAIVNENIEVVKDQILRKPEGMTEVEVDRLRDRLSIMEEMRDTPQNNIDKLTSEEEEVEEIDPFDTVESIAERKKA
jgi:hypothetical protein